MSVFASIRNNPARFQKTIYRVAVALVMVELYYAVFIRAGDFEVHRKFGQDFIDGIPYYNNGNLYFLPRAMFDVTLVLFDYYTARVLFYLGAIAALVYCVKAWTQMASKRFSLKPDDAYLASAISVAIMLPFLVRDLDECGLQIYLLLFLTLAARSFLSGKKSLCGFYVAVAVCYKATPLLFLPFLLWKRQWHVSAAVAVWFIILNMLPAFWLGWDGNLAAHGKWLERIQIVSQTAEAYPSLATLEAPKQQNVGLRATIARYIETYPEGHPLKLDHPLFFQFGDLEAETAKRVVVAVILVLGGFIAWRFRRPWREEKGGGEFAVEWAVACLFAALLSPVTWKQHLVLGLPCIMLAVYSAFYDRRTIYRMVAIAVIAAVFLLTKRFLVGREMSYVFVSYKLDTLAMLWAAVLTMFSPGLLKNSSSMLDDAPAKDRNRSPDC